MLQKVEQLQPYVIHIEHEFGLYEYIDDSPRGDRNAGFLEMLSALSDWPRVIELHTIHGRLSKEKANFVYQACQRCDVMLFKCPYQKWRLEWSFPERGWNVPHNIMVTPHGTHPDRRWRLEEVPRLRQDLGLDRIPDLSQHLVGLIGWIQSNIRWDILTSMWEEIASEIYERSGTDWDLPPRVPCGDPQHKPDYELYRSQIQLLEAKQLAHYYEFIPRGDTYDKMMAVCDFIVLPSIDETQSSTLARIVSLNKPYVTTAPMEGFTAQTIACGGELLFTNKQNLREAVVRLACDENRCLELGHNLETYLDGTVSWTVVAQQYEQAHELAPSSIRFSLPVELPSEYCGKSGRKSLRHSVERVEASTELAGRKVRRTGGAKRPPKSMLCDSMRHPLFQVL